MAIFKGLPKGSKRSEERLGDTVQIKKLKGRLMKGMLGTELTGYPGYEAGTEPSDDLT